MAPAARGCLAPDTPSSGQAPARAAPFSSVRWLGLDSALLAGLCPVRPRSLQSCVPGGCPLAGFRAPRLNAASGGPLSGLSSWRASVQAVGHGGRGGWTAHHPAFGSRNLPCRWSPSWGRAGALEGSPKPALAPHPPTARLPDPTPCSGCLPPRPAGARRSPGDRGEATARGWPGPGLPLLQEERAGPGLLGCPHPSDREGGRGTGGKEPL